MYFYAGRVSLLKNKESLFYKPGNENKISYFIKEMSKPFEAEMKRGVKLINEPWIHPTKGFFGGVIGKVARAKLPVHDGVQFFEKSELVHPHVHYLFLRSQQVLLVEKKTSVFNPPDRLFQYLSYYLDELLCLEGLSVYIEPLTTKGDFWRTLRELKCVHEVRFKFVAPNFLGEANREMKLLLETVNRETGATEVEHNLTNPSGQLTIPENQKYKDAVSWIEDGGGSWEIIRRASDGKMLLTTLFDLKLVALFGRRARGLALQI